MKKMHVLRTGWLALMCWMVFHGGVFAQYTLDEIGVNLGGGYALYDNSAGSLGGPAFNANAFYGHYFCGKAYGIHATAGLNGYLPSTSDGTPFLSDPAAGQSSLMFLAADFGFYFKAKLRDYHRPREVALLIGPKANLPFLTRFNSENGDGALRFRAENVSALTAGIHVSLQFRRPAPEKKSWFIQPGAEYYVLPAFRSIVAGDVTHFYFFLNFGYAFWDKRG